MIKRLWRIIIGAAVLATAVLLSLNNEWLQIALFIISYIIVGYDILKNGYKKTYQTDWISIITIEYPVDLIRFIIFLEI